MSAESNFWFEGKREPCKNHGTVSYTEFWELYREHYKHIEYLVVEDECVSLENLDDYVCDLADNNCEEDEGVHLYDVYFGELYPPHLYTTRDQAENKLVNLWEDYHDIYDRSYDGDSFDDCGPTQTFMEEGMKFMEMFISQLAHATPVIEPKAYLSIIVSPEERKELCKSDE